jgi:hypothetical protein
MIEGNTNVINLPMEVSYQPAWLTWVASTTTCLRALGVECDTVDVAGFSGYAFHCCVHEALCPSGPTELDWSQLSRAAHCLGRATIEFRSPCCESNGTAREESCRAAFEMVRAELQAGRPCVLWGTYLPEFGVAVGIEGESYRVKSFKEVLGEEEPLIPYNRTEPPGGVYVLGFPAKAEYGELQRDLETILLALRSWSLPPWGVYRYGAQAYELWIDALRSGRAERFGCGYNTACYAEARRFAQRFFERMSARRPLAADLLRKVAESYRQAADAMKGVSEIFPFIREEHGTIADSVRIERATTLLARAHDAERRAMSALSDITHMKAPEPPPADEAG